MAVDMPKPIADYISAANAGRTEGLDRCFSGDAVVHDEGEMIKGLDAIKQWMAETKRKYQHTLEPIVASVESDGKTIVTNRLAGNFPGSPIELEFVFELEGDKITSLEILS
jgi:hypothetical protein